MTRLVVNVSTGEAVKSAAVTNPAPAGGEPSPSAAEIVAALIDLETITAADLEAAKNSLKGTGE